jgi:hypothetical protein
MCKYETDVDHFVLSTGIGIYMNIELKATARGFFFPSHGKAFE